MKLIPFASLIFSSIVLINGQEKEALIFDRFNRSLFDLPNEIPKNAKCGAWAVACPAETSPEIDFIKKYSSTKNALFVKEIHERGSKASEVMKNVCKESFKLSMVYHMKSSTFRFGFEIYYKLKDADYFHNENFQDFKTIEEVIANMFSIVKKTKYKAEEYKRMAMNAAGISIEELWFNNNRKMGFTWIELVKFGYETSKRILRNMAYNISTNSQWPVKFEKCEDYKLGNEIYKDIGVEKLYSKDTKKIFDGYNLPKTLSCNSNKECFVKSLIIPLDQFHFGSSTSPSCSNLATIPLWKITTAEASLKRVDQYLYSLYQVAGEPLHIIAGISGEHAYSKNKSWGKVPIYLDPERKKIPIPKIVYKIVEYRVKNCKLEEKQCWYSSIIVIHNDPFFKPADKVCPGDITTNWGWQGIKGSDDAGTVYVCPRDKYVMTKLFGILGSDKYAESPDLKLTHFPRSKDGQKIDPENISQDVHSRYEKFLREGEDLSERAKKIMELAHDDYDNPDDKELLYSGVDTVRQVEGEKERDRAEVGKEEA